MPESKLPALPQNEIDAELKRQQLAHIREYYAQVHRLDTVAFRLRVANRKDCESTAPLLGLEATTPHSLPRKYRAFAHEALDITWARPTAISVVEGSPAAQAGLAIRDEVTAFNGELIPVSGTRTWIAGWLKRNGVKPIQVDYRRAGTYLTTTVTPVMGCSIPINVVTADEANANTDGRRITIYTGIMNLAKTDAQLAAVVGHEMAHANLGHIEKGQLNAIAGMAGGAIVDGGFLLGGISTGGAFSRWLGKVGARAYSVGFEREADYVGAYYVARAGYDLTGVEQFWYAMGQAHPDSIRLASTHPTAPVRFIQMQKVAAEIAEKKGRGLPLDPDLKFADTQPPMQTGELIR